jgi:hypothetical protein
MATLTQTNRFLRNHADVRQRLSINARESSAFEGVRVSARQIQLRPRSMVSAKKSAKGR